MISKNFIGVGVGGLFGFWSQDPADNPFASLFGATIGGVMGHYVTEDIAKQHQNYQEKLAKKIFDRLHFSDPKDFAEKVKQNLFDVKQLKSASFNHQMGYFQTVFENLKINHSLRNYTQFTPDDIDHLVQLASNAPASRHQLEKLEKETRGFRSNLTQTAISAYDIPKPVRIKSGNYDEIYDALFKSLQKNGLSEADARKQAMGLGLALQGHEISIHSGMGGLAEKIDVAGLGESLYLSQHVTMEDGFKVRATGLRALTPDELRSGRSIGIMSSINPYIGQIDNNLVEHSFDHSGKSTGFTKKMVTIHHAQAAMSGEELIGNMAIHAGRGLTVDELRAGFRMARSTIDYNAYHTSTTIKTASIKVDAGRTLSVGDDGNLSFDKTDRRTFTRFLDKGIELGKNFLEGISHNTTMTFSSGKWGGPRPFDFLAQGQYGAGHVNVREALPLHQSDLINAFSGEHAYLKEHSNVTGNLYISDAMNEYIAKKFGSQFHISDGSSILIEPTRGGSLGANYIKRTEVLGVMDRNGGKYSWHNFGDLLNDDFFNLPVEEKLKRLGTKRNIGRDQLLGLGKDGEEIKLPGYADSGEITDIIKTKRGIEVQYNAISYNRSDWVKIFSQNQKSGATVARGKIGRHIKMLGLLEARGLVSAKDGQLYSAQGTQITDLDQIFKNVKVNDGTLGQLWREAVGIGHVTTYRRGRQAILEDILSGTRGTELKEFVSSMKSTKSIADDKYLGNLLSQLETNQGSRSHQANIYRMLALHQEDQRYRQAIMENLAISNYSKKTGIDSRTLMNAGNNLMSPHADQRRFAQEFMFNQIQSTYGTDDSNMLSQRSNFFTFSHETGPAIHGAGRVSSASHLQLAGMKFNGFTDDMISSLYDINTDIAQDLEYIMSSTKEGNVKNLDNFATKRIASVFDAVPEERAQQLKNLGIAVNDNAAYASYQLAVDHLGYKSIPIAFNSTNRTNINSFGSDTTDVLSRLDKARQRVVAADAAFRLDPGSKGEVIKAIDAMHAILAEHIGDITKEGIKRKSKVGLNMIARSIGGEAWEVQEKLRKDLGEVGFIDEGTLDRIKAQMKANGITAEIDTTEEIQDGFKRIKLKYKSGAKFDLLGLDTREPAQGLQSTMSKVMILNTKLKNSNGEFLYQAEGPKDTITGKILDSFSAIFQKKDFDADTTAVTFTSSLNEDQAHAMKAQHEIMMEQAERYRALAAGLDPKRSKKAGVRSILDTKSKALYEMNAKLTGQERKYSAGLVTVMNQEFTQALARSGGDKTSRELGRVVIGQLTESLLKTSHKQVAEHDMGQNVINMINSIKATRNGGRYPGTPMVTREDFSKQMQEGFDTLFGSVDQKVAKDYEAGRNFAINSMYDMLTQTEDVADTRSPTLSVNPDLLHEAGDVSKVIERNITDPDRGFMHAGGNVTASVKEATPPPLTSGRVAQQAQESFSDLLKRNKTPLLVGGALLGGLAILNGASATELPANRMPKQSSNPNQQLEPKRDIKAYNRKLRKDPAQEAYDVRIKLRDSALDKQRVKRFLTGNDGTVRTDINITRT